MYNSQTEDIVVLKISSKIGLEQYDIPFTNKQLEEGELHVESKIMIDNPVTAYREMVHQKIGRVSNALLIQVKQKMREFYEI